MHGLFRFLLPEEELPEQHPAEDQEVDGEDAEDQPGGGGLVLSDEAQDQEERRAQKHGVEVLEDQVLRRRGLEERVDLPAEDQARAHSAGEHAEEAEEPATCTGKANS